jgi:parallel beta-helix repeat protein
MSKRQRRSRDRRRRQHAVHPSRRQVAAGAGLALGATLGITGTAHAADFTVSNLSDSGAGSLRQAVIDANNNPGADRVLFQSGLTGTIGLTTGQLAIKDPVEIVGPGPGTLTVQNTGVGRIAYVYPGNGQSVTVSGLTLIGASGNDVTNGGIFYAGGVASASNLTVSNSVLTGSAAINNGGAIQVYNGSLQVESSTISGNTAGSAGGGIYFYSSAGPSAIRNTTISGNTTTGSYNDGGAVYLNNVPLSPILIENSTLVGNRVGDRGGAIYDFSSPTSALTIESSTIAGNYAGNEGGGVDNKYATTIRNTIIADNTAGDNADITFDTDPANASFSLIERPGAGVTSTGPNILGQDPQLGPLQNNGGPTRTQLPADTSPVINKGAAFGLTTDQRGGPRPLGFPGISNAPGGDGSDIGALEVESNSFKAKLKGKKLIVTVFAPGTVGLSDAKAPLSAQASKKKKRKLFLKSSSASGGPPKITVPLRLTKLAKKKLRQKGKVGVKARVTFTPKFASARTQKLKLKVKGKKKK